MDRSADFRRGRHVIYKLHVHLVFVTKYRRGVITDRVRNDLEASMRKVCENFEAELIEIDGQDDHLHLLIAYPPKVSISRLTNSLKGVSSRRALQLNYPEVRHTPRGNAFWSPSYYALSADGAPLETIKRYIQDQC